MTDVPPQPYIYEGVDPVAEPRSAGVFDMLSNAANKISEIFSDAKKPGMPLSVLSNVAREAPLASLLTAFLLGVAFSRRK